MLAPTESAPHRPSPLPLPSALLLAAELGPVVMADDPCEAAFGSVDPTGPRNYYRARYYDPKIGRFLSEDPIGLDGGVNLYAYVDNAPTLLTDPLGLKKMRFLGPKPERDKLKRAWKIVKKTRRGRSMADQIEDDKDGWAMYPACKSAATDRPSKVILLDPDFTPPVLTTEGWQPSTLEANMAHEMGHAVGDTDLSPVTDYMLNTILNENPVRQELGLPSRIGYFPPE